MISHYNLEIKQIAQTLQVTIFLSDLALKCAKFSDLFLESPSSNTIQIPKPLNYRIYIPDNIINRLTDGNPVG